MDILCIHYFFNQNEIITKALFEPADKLPFHFVWIGDRMVVSGNPREVDGLARGDEILSVDGTPSPVIQARLIPYMRADGANDDKRRALLDVTGSDRIESFDVFHPLLFPRADERITLVRRRSLDDVVQTIRVNAIGLAERRAMAP